MISFIFVLNPLFASKDFLLSFSYFAQETWKTHALMKSVLKGHIVAPTFMTVWLYDFK